jgi:hypothetical protein
VEHIKKNGKKCEKTMNKVEEQNSYKEASNAGGAKKPVDG